MAVLVLADLVESGVPTERALELRLREPGVWHVLWLVRDESPFGTHELPPATIQVEEGTELTTIAIEPPAGEYGGILTKLR